MKERPILFSAPMVRAILNGSKTQTRRVLKPQPPGEADSMFICHHPDPRPHFYAFDGTALMDFAVPCPYGKPGDQLWVRETWRKGFYPDTSDRSWRGGSTETYLYRADEGSEIFKRGWKPSIHMPREASRIQLEITNIRIERLQDISAEDCKAEGILPNWCGDLAGFDGDEHGWLPFELRPGEENIPGVDIYEQLTPQRAYQVLWESINGPGSWDANPWVWVVEFRRIKP